MIHKLLLKVILREFLYKIIIFLSIEIACRFYFDRYNCLNNDIILDYIYLDYIFRYCNNIIILLYSFLYLFVFIYIKTIIAKLNIL